MIRSMILIGLASIPTSLLGQTPERAQFNRAAREILAHWADPGAVVIVVKDTDLLLAEGFGTTRLKGGQPVTPKTLASVASVTKTINSVALAMLVADGHLRWDDPVRQHVPEFEFADEYRTERTTIRDLITHRGGLPAVMGGLWSRDYSIEDLLGELPASKPRIGFRERVDYSQVGIALLGEVVRRASGMTWAEFVHARIFEPLGMESSYAGTGAFLTAHPDRDEAADVLGRVHRRDDGQYVQGPWRGAGDIYTPAGGVVTSGEDMAKFMSLLLARGQRDDGQFLLSADAIGSLHTPHEVEGSPYGRVVSPFGGLVAYGLGWILHDYKGHRIVEHAGSNFGSSVLALAPAARVGVFVTTSANFSLDSDRLVSALKFAGLSYGLGLEQQDWVELLTASR